MGDFLFISSGLQSLAVHKFEQLERLLGKLVLLSIEANQTESFVCVYLKICPGGVCGGLLLVLAITWL